nr:MAG TPA: hypothetical protein [Caudoviricetes sp.]
MPTYNRLKVNHLNKKFQNPLKIFYTKALLKV